MTEGFLWGRHDWEEMFQRVPGLSDALSVPCGTRLLPVGLSHALSSPSQQQRLSLSEADLQQQAVEAEKQAADSASDSNRSNGRRVGRSIRVGAPHGYYSSPATPTRALERVAR